MENKNKTIEFEVIEGDKITLEKKQDNIYLLSYRLDNNTYYLIVINSYYMAIDDVYIITKYEFERLKTQIENSEKEEETAAETESAENKVEQDEEPTKAKKAVRKSKSTKDKK